MRGAHVIGQVFIAAKHIFDQRMIHFVLTKTLPVVLLDATRVASAENRFYTRGRLRHDRPRAHRRHSDQRAVAQALLLNPLLEVLGQALDELALG